MRSIAWEQALILVGLVLLFVFSFLGGWIQLSFTCPANDVYCTSNSATVNSLWNGFGILPALIIVVAIVWFVVTEIPAVRLVAPVRASTAWRETWIAFAAVEIVLFLIDWLIEGSGYSGYSSTPGWVLIISIIFAAVVGIGGYLERQRGLRLTAASGPASGPDTLPAGPVSMPASPPRGWRRPPAPSPRTARSGSTGPPGGTPHSRRRRAPSGRRTGATGGTAPPGGPFPAGGSGRTASPQLAARGSQRAPASRSPAAASRSWTGTRMRPTRVNQPAEKPDP